MQPGITWECWRGINSEYRFREVTLQGFYCTCSPMILSWLQHTDSARKLFAQVVGESLHAYASVSVENATWHSAYSMWSHGNVDETILILHETAMYLMPVVNARGLGLSPPPTKRIKNLKYSATGEQKRRTIKLIRQFNANKSEACKHFHQHAARLSRLHGPKFSSGEVGWNVLKTLT